MLMFENSAFKSKNRRMASVVRILRGAAKRKMMIVFIGYVFRYIFIFVFPPANLSKN